MRKVAENLGDDFRRFGMMTHQRSNPRAEQGRGEHRFVPEGINVSLLARIDGLRARRGIVVLGADGIHPDPHETGPGETNSLDKPRMPEFHVANPYLVLGHLSLVISL